MTLLLNNSDGKPSLSFTMVYTAFLVAVLWFALSMFDIKHVRAFDVTTVSGFLTPLMALYFGRRWNDAKTPPGEPASPSE